MEFNKNLYRIQEPHDFFRIIESLISLLNICFELKLLLVRTKAQTFIDKRNRSTRL